MAGGGSWIVSGYLVSVILETSTNHRPRDWRHYKPVLFITETKYVVRNLVRKREVRTDVLFKTQYTLRQSPWPEELVAPICLERGTSSHQNARVDSLSLRETGRDQFEDQEIICITTLRIGQNRGMIQVASINALEAIRFQRDFWLSGCVAEEQTTDSDVFLRLRKGAQISFAEKIP